MAVYSMQKKLSGAPKISNEWMIYIAMFFMNTPGGLPFIYNDVVSTFANLCCSIFCAIYLYLYLRKGKASICMIIIFALSLWIYTLQYLKGDPFLATAFSLVLTIGRCCFYEYEIKKDSLRFFKHMYFYCFALALLNLISLFLLPQGIYESERFGYYQLLGNHNEYIVIILPGICAGYYALKNNAIKVQNYLVYWLTVFMTYFMERSAGSIIAMVIICGFVLFLNRRYLRAFLNGPMYVLIATSLQYFLVFVPKSNNIMWAALLTFFDKSDSISGRTYIWSRAVSDMSRYKWMVTGVHNTDLQEWLNRSFLYDCHNALLEISYHTGLLGLALWFALLILIAYNLSTTYYDKISRMFGCAFFAYILVLGISFFSYVNIFSVLVMINSGCLVIKRQHRLHRTELTQPRSIDIGRVK